MSKRLSIFLILPLLFFVVSLAHTQDAPTIKKIVYYKMDVKLNTEKKVITGEEKLTWLNDSDREVNELYFHLYLNAFKNNQSTFVQEGMRFRGWSRYINLIKKEYWGYCKVNSMQLLDDEGNVEADISDTMEYVQPDGMDKEDQTVLKVTLPRPVPPGEKITLNISFISKLPRAFARTGYVEDYYFVAQWFPKIGVLWDGEWNCHQFHAMGEFFADYGDYDFTLTLPKGYVVGATGELQGEPKENPDGTVSYNFYQENVHDYTWTASQDYLVFNKTFEEEGLKKVEITLLLQPEHKNLKDRYFEATECALKYYGLWFGEYPYGHITTVDPAYNSRAGGMEYPTIFTGGTRLFSPKESLSPEGITVHEAGHQWWYGLVGNNEFEHAWLDEGFNTYSESRAQQVYYGSRYYVLRYFGFPLVYHRIRIPHFADLMNSYRPYRNYDDMNRISWEYIDSTSYYINAYNKAALMLRTLEKYLGEDLFFTIMKTYFSRFSYGHPRPDDFIQIVNEVSGQDMNWFFDQIAFGSGEVDYAIERVSSRPPSTKMGLFDKDDEPVYIDGKTKKEEKKEKKKEEKIIYTSEVTVRRLGEVKIPVEVLIVFENGEKVIEKWDGQYRWIRYQYEKPNKIKYAHVDPEHKLVLDINYTNNSKYRETKSFSSYKWASRWMFWLQHLMETFSFFS
jgi:hypothetical protein